METVRAECTDILGSTEGSGGSKEGDGTKEGLKGGEGEKYGTKGRGGTKAGLEERWCEKGYEKEKSGKGTRLTCRVGRGPALFTF